RLICWPPWLAQGAQSRRFTEGFSLAAITVVRRTPVDIALTSIFVLALPPLGLAAAVATLLMGRVQGLHLALFGIGFVLTGCGITVGYHRLLTHRSVETSGAVKALMLILGSMPGEG